MEILDPEVILFLGMSIDILLALYTSSGVVLKAKITNISTSEKSQIEICADLSEFPVPLENDLINHLLQNSDTNPEQLRLAGFKVREISNSFKFRYIRTADEYNEVLRVRLLAYREAGKVDDTKTAMDMVAPLDHLSRILVAYHGKKIVAAVALSFPETEDLVLDTQRGLSEKKYPEDLPTKTRVIEVARLCTVPEYRRGDLLLRMFEQIYKVFALSGRDFLLTSTDDKLWPMYRKLGFKKSKYSYNHPHLAGIKHSIITIHKDTGLKSQSIDALRWNYLYREMTLYIEERARFEYSIKDRIKLWLYRKIGILLRIRPNKSY